VRAQCSGAPQPLSELSVTGMAQVTSPFRRTSKHASPMTVRRRISIIFSIWAAILLLPLLWTTHASAQTAYSVTAGWNLLGNSSTSPINVAGTFGDSSKFISVWKWNKATGKWAIYVPSLSAMELTSYAQGQGYDVLTSIASKDGFWVKASTPSTVVGPIGSGVTLAASDLQLGWNLVSTAENKTPSQLSIDLSGRLAVASKSIISIWTWNPSSSKWGFYSPSLGLQGGTALADYIISKGFVGLTSTTSSTQGYWVNVGATTSSVAGYVAKNGNDSNPGTISLPFRSIQKCAATAGIGSVCLIREGTYYETVTPNSGITIRPYNDESVTIDGTDPITGWTSHQGSIYKASAQMSSGDTNQVFIGQQMMTEARWPNGYDLLHVNWATAKAGTTATQIVDSNIPSGNWTGAKINIWSGIDPWEPLTGEITASQNGRLAFNLDGDLSMAPYIEPMPEGYYYLFGTLVALDTQREWFYDNSAKTLYFWAPGGVNPGTLNVRAKQREYCIDLGGRSNVVIGNLNLFACTINSDVSSTNNLISGINATYVSHYTRIPNISGSPGSWEGAHVNDSGIIVNGSGNVLSDSTISYSAGNGVALMGKNNIVRNNLIHHVAYMGKFFGGVALQGTGHKIQNNTIYASGNRAIMTIDITTTNNIDIGHNNIYQVMMLSSDGGAFYIGAAWVNGQAAKSTLSDSRIHHNWAHDIQPLYPSQSYTLGGLTLASFYFDGGAGGWEVDQNVMWNNQMYSIMVNGSPPPYIPTLMSPPNNNNIHNNSVIDVGEKSFILILDVKNCGSTRVSDNYVLVPVTQWGQSACTVTNNGTSAPGASEMSSATQVGCNFVGCASGSPPNVFGGLVSASISYQPWPIRANAGESATFTVIGHGSGTLTYQWQRNGTNIVGATNSTYTLSATSLSDSGSIFGVTVSNSLGSIKSEPVVLTVQ